MQKGIETKQYHVQVHIETKPIVEDKMLFHRTFDFFKKLETIYLLI